MLHSLFRLKKIQPKYSYEVVAFSLSSSELFDCQRWLYLRITDLKSFGYDFRAKNNNDYYL